MMLRLKLLVFFWYGLFSSGLNLIQSQVPSGTQIDNFRVSEKSLDNKRSTLLSGEKAVFLEGGTMSLINPRLVSVTAEGKTNLIFNASECLYNQETKIISSPGKLSLITGDRQMKLSGLGFTGNLVGPTLSISSNVQAKLNKNLRSFSFRDATVTDNDEDSEIIISSKEFELMSSRAEFRGIVTVKDGEGDLRADVVRIELLNEDWEIQSIQGIGNVLIKNEQILIRSIQGEGRANYDLETGTILFDGNPIWNIGDRSGSADSIMINRESMFVSAQGNVIMKVPDDSLEGAALFQFNPISNNNTDQISPLLKIKSKRFVFSPPQNGQNGYARYIGSVQLKRGESQMDCEYLNIIMSSNDGVLTEAMGVNVKLSQAENLLASQLAFYDFKEGKITMEMNPTWDFQDQKGQAKRVKISIKPKKFKAQGDVKMLLSKVNGFGNLLFPLNDNNSNLKGNTTMLLNCGVFEYIQSFDNVESDYMKLDGNVLLSGENGFDLMAKSIGIKIDSINNNLNSIEAIGELRGSTIGQNPMRFNGSYLNYDKKTDLLRLTGDPRVEIRTEQDGSEVIAIGNMAIYKVSDGKLSLVGNPLLKTTEGELRGAKVIYDQKKKRLRASGDWKMTLNIESFPQVHAELNKMKE